MSQYDVASPEYIEALTGKISDDGREITQLLIGRPQALTVVRALHACISGPDVDQANEAASMLGALSGTFGLDVTNYVPRSIAVRTPGKMIPFEIIVDGQDPFTQDEETSAPT